MLDLNERTGNKRVIAVLEEIFEGEGVEEEPEQKAGEPFSADSVSPLKNQAGEEPGRDQS